MSVQRVADVISLPVRKGVPVAAEAASATYRRAMGWTANEVDNWGRDNGFVNRIWSLSGWRWHTSVGGAEHIPRRAGALVVVNARRFALAPIFAALAIGHETDRPVRFVGRPDIAPFGPVMQRLGGLLPVATELEGVLRAGEVVVLGSAPQPSNEFAGLVDHHLVGAAIAARVRVLPAATISTPVRRSARVEIGRPISLRKRRRGPLAELETADAAQARIDALLDELGGTSTGTPLDWLPLGLPGVS
jgi:hypothetical protein